MRRGAVRCSFCVATPVSGIATLTDYMAVWEKQMLFWAWCYFQGDLSKEHGWKLGTLQKDGALEFIIRRLCFSK